MPKNTYTSGNPYVKAFNDAMGTFKDFSTFLADPGERQNIRQGAMDAINRGAVAGALGFPVDTANAALNLGKAAVGYLGNKAGVLSADQMPKLIDNPVGGSEYIGNQMQRFGMVTPNRNALAEGIAGFLPISPSASGKAVAALAGGGVVPGMDLAATVFHGSPHKFDKFDSSKIGTGEGAQAYGHGLYFAESPEVANTYKLAGVDAVNLVGRDGGAINLSALPQPLQKALAANAGAPDLLGNAQRFLANKFNQDYYSEKYGASSIDAAVKALQDLRASGVSVENPGSLYKVDLPDEAINKMLDWDKPLSQQAPEVQAAMKSMVGDVTGGGFDLSRSPRNVRNAFDASATQSAEAALSAKYGATKTAAGWVDKSGRPIPQDSVDKMLNKIGGKSYDNAGQLYSDLAHITGSQSDISATLRNYGIPGIRYLDGGSRGAGQGSSNYVVFPGNENMLRILERNGQAVGGRVAAPQDEALRLAQQRASLPVSQGGLGLPANNTAQQRAQAMGFDVNKPLYHATDAATDFDAFMVSPKGKLGAGVYTSPVAKYTEKYAGEDARIMPLVGRGKFTTEDERIAVFDAIRQQLVDQNPNFSMQELKDKLLQELKRQGFSGSDMDKERVVFDPENLRSRFAAFDPFRKTAATAAALGVAAPNLLAAESKNDVNQLRRVQANRP